MQAPSACNQQPWEFYVVTDKRRYRNCLLQPHIPSMQQGHRS
ncbi:MAG: nitroreductase family protein [Anaerobutyricum sp.]